MLLELKASFSPTQKSCPKLIFFAQVPENEDDDENDHLCGKKDNEESCRDAADFRNGRARWRALGGHSLDRDVHVPLHDVQALFDILQIKGTWFVNIRGARSIL